MGINANSKNGRQLNYHVADNVEMTGEPEDALQPIQNVPSGVRKIIVHKFDGRLGFNIVGGEDGLGIYISFIMKGWLRFVLSRTLVCLELFSL